MQPLDPDSYTITDYVRISGPQVERPHWKACWRQTRRCAGATRRCCTSRARLGRTPRSRRRPGLQALVMRRFPQLLATRVLDKGLCIVENARLLLVPSVRRVPFPIVDDHLRVLPQEEAVGARDVTGL